MKRNFDAMLERAINFHGHKCVGLVLGTRIAMAGLQALEMNRPADTYDLIVYVEIDRCLADSIQAITGCTIGHRRMKHVDYGKFAATFVDTRDGTAVRVSVREEARNLVTRDDKKDGTFGKRRDTNEKVRMELMMDAYSKMPDKKLLIIREVRVQVPELDLPGKPQRKETCAICGERIFDGREVIVKEKKLCRPCADGAYYTTQQSSSR